MVNIVWEEPADNRLVRTDFGEVAAALRANPGRYAVIAEGLNGSRTQASSLALGVRRGKYAAFKPVGAWFSKSSKDKVWAKFVGENQEYATDEERELILTAMSKDRERAARKAAGPVSDTEDASAQIDEGVTTEQQ